MSRPILAFIGGESPHHLLRKTPSMIDTRCLESSLLTADEREHLSPLLSGAALEWLQVRTAAI